MSTRYNDLGKPTEITTDPDKPSHWLRVNLDYDEFGNVTQRTTTGADIAPRTSTTVYDVRGHYPINTTNALGHTSHVTTYNWYCGQVTATRDPNGLTSRVEFDQFCRKKKETRPDGNSTHYVYRINAPDANGYRSYEIETRVDGVDSPSKALYNYVGRNYANQYPVLDNTAQVVTKHDKFGRVIAKVIHVF